MDDSYAAATQDGGSNVPTFLLKLLNMLDDASNHELVDWSPAGNSFIVKDQVKFSKVVLPKYFKHNKFASFVRQLNMYGFRKITSLTQSSLNSEKEEVEFYHYLFIRGEEHMLERIKRKVNKPDASRPSEDVGKVLADVTQMRNYQENMNSRLNELKQENEDLWREVVSLRQKHAHQQKVVNKLIQFLVNLVHQTGMGMKRKLPLMIEDVSTGSSSQHSASKYSKKAFDSGETAPLALEQSAKPTVSFPPSVADLQGKSSVSSGSGPYITEVTSQPHQGDLTEVFPQQSASDFEHVSSEAPGVSTIPSPEEVNETHWEPDPPDALSSLIQPQHFESTNDEMQPSNQWSQPTDPPAVAQNEIARYEPPRSPRLCPSELNSHVDMMQNNLESIQDMLFNNDQVQLDYGLIQELFSTSPDIMPPADVSSAEPSVTGNELVLRSSAEDDKHSDASYLDQLL